MAHIYTNHGEPETLQGTPEHEWAGEAQTARRPGSAVRKVLLGKLIRCTECWKTAGRITIRQTVMQSTYSRYDSKKETILQGRTKTYKLNIQQRYIWVADQESCCRQSTKFTWCRSTDKKMKSVDVSQERGNKSGPKDKAQRMGAPRPSLT